MTNPSLRQLMRLLTDEERIIGDMLDGIPHPRRMEIARREDKGTMTPDDRRQDATQSQCGER